MRAIMVGFSALLFLVAVACSESADIEGTVQARVEATVGAQPVPEGKVIKEWSGNGNLQTEAFTIDASSWAIEWAYKAPPIIGFFSVSVFDADTKQVTDNPILTNLDGGNTSFIHSKGNFYLLIQAAGGWTVRVFVPD